MKRRSLAIMFTAALMLSLGAAGCGSKENAGETKKEEVKTEEAKEDTFKVTFYDSDGKTELKTVDVKSGECAEEYVPEKEGQIFTGWFGTPKMTHKFDFTQAITADTDIFAGFVTYQEDKRGFAVLGSGTSPVLLESNWGNVIGDAQKLTKEENSEANVYTITMDLAAGDEFQFAMDTSTGASWLNQRGYGYLDTISKDGKDYFENSGGLGDTSTKRSNIKCAIAGNYTFTLTTYPAEDFYETENPNYKEDNKEAFNVNPYDKITWTYNGESTTDNSDSRTDYYIKGAKITDWKDVYSDETRFTEEAGVYTLTVDLTKGDEFMFTSTVTVGDQTGVGNEYIRFSNIAETDEASRGFVSGTESMNLVAEQDGTYTFTYDAASKVLTVSCQ